MEAQERDKTAKITEKGLEALKWRDFSLMQRLLEGEPERKKKSDRGHRLGVSAKSRGRKRRLEKSTG